MRKILLLVLLCFGLANATTTTFTNAVSTDWNNAGNWSAGIPTATDSAVINCASVCSLTIADTVMSINFIGGGFKANKKILQVDSTFSWNSSGTIVYDTTLRVGKLLSIANIGTTTFTNTILNRIGSAKFTLTTARTLSFSRYMGGGIGTVDSLAGSVINLVGLDCFSNNGGTSVFSSSWIIASGTANKNNNIVFDGSSRGTATPIFGTGAGGAKITLPAMNMANSVIFRNGASAGNDTVNITGAISDSATLTMSNTSSGTNCNHFTNGYAIYAKTSLLIGNSSTSVGTWDFSSSPVTVGSFAQTSLTGGTQTVLLGSSSWNCLGNWTWSATPTVNAGTSTVAFSGSTAATLTSSNKSFYNLVDSLNTGVKLTLADSAKVLNNLRIVSGKFFTAGFNLNVGGDLAMGGADTSNLSTSRITLTKRGATWTQTSTGVRLSGGASIVAPLGMVFVRDSNGTFYNINIGDECRLGLTAGKTLKDSTYTAGDLEGTSLSVRDTISSNSDGSQATFNIPANTALSYDVIKDVAFVNAVFCTTGGYNGGNVTNCTWDSIKCASITYGGTMLTTGGIPCTLSTTHGRTSQGTVSVGVTSATVTSQAADTIIFTAPAKSAGTYKIYASNGNGMIDSALTLTYTTGVTGPTISVQPQSHTDTIGTTAVFTVSATGTGVLSYQWRSKQVSGAWGNIGTNSSTLTTATLVAADTGSKYCVLVTDDNGTTASDTATLTVFIPALAVSVQPQSAIDTIGSTHDFSVTASGYGTLTYQWRKKTVSGAWSDVGTNSASYNTGALSRADTNSKYCVLITDQVPRTVSSDTATLTVRLYPPIIAYAASPAICSTGIAYTHPVTNTSILPIDSFAATGLVSGVTLNRLTGTISILTDTARTKFAVQVIAYNSSGQDTAWDTLTIRQGKPGISYSTNPARYPLDVAITANTMSNAAGGALDSVKISPALPTGLSINSGTGAITGTPTVKTAATSYTVIAYNAIGNGSVNLIISTGQSAGLNSGFSRSFRQTYRGTFKNSSFR